MERVRERARFWNSFQLATRDAISLMGSLRCRRNDETSFPSKYKQSIGMEILADQETTKAGTTLLNRDSSKKFLFKENYQNH
jgi:hypothetical protein